MKKLEDLSQANAKEDDRCFLASSFCFLQVLKLYTGMVLESLERLCNLKPLFHTWQTQYSRQNLMKNSPAKAKAAQMLKQIKGKGGVLKAELAKVKLMRMNLENLKINYKHL
jgi:hypothetical protein